MGPESLLDSTGVAWVVVGTVAAGVMTLVLLGLDLIAVDEAVAPRRRRRLPTVASTEQEARRRIRRLLLPPECLEPETEAAEAAPAAAPPDSLASPLALLRWNQTRLKRQLGTLGKSGKIDLERWKYVDDRDARRQRAGGRTPLLCFVNVRSGGQQGKYVLQALRHLFRNDHQVVDMSSVRDPIRALHNFARVPRFRVLCCGGDGTVASVLEMLDQVSRTHGLLYKPPVGILPLGTGNDLARVLGWGGGYEGGDLLSWLEAVACAEVTLLDRWQVTLSPALRRRGQPEATQMVMNNYFGVGVDAKISLGFHTSRQTRPNLFTNRMVNKLVYAGTGWRELLSWGQQRSYAKLHTKLRLECDGREVMVPYGLEGIIVLNIASYGGGCDLWQSRHPGAGAGSDSDTSEEEEEEAGGWGVPGRLPRATQRARMPRSKSEGFLGNAGRRGRARRGRVDLGDDIDASESGDSVSVDQSGQGEGSDDGESSDWASDASEVGSASTGASSQRRRLSDRRHTPNHPRASNARRVSDGVGAFAGARRRRQSSSRASGQSAYWRRQSMSDRLLEVVGVNGVLHLGSTQIGIGGATRLAQCSECRLTLSETLPTQVDGEPFESEPGEITISAHGQSFMLQRATDLAGLSAAVDAVDSCMDRGTITAEQRNVIIHEMARRSHQRRATARAAPVGNGMRRNASMSASFLS